MRRCLADSHAAEGKGGHIAARAAVFGKTQRVSCGSPSRARDILGPHKW
jgi:hypothetical protein